MMSTFGPTASRSTRMWSTACESVARPRWHLGRATLSQAVDHMRVLREAVGPNVDIMVDVNQQWTVKQAIASMRALAPFQPYWLEDATSNVDFAGLRQISEAIDVA